MPSVNFHKTTSQPALGGSRHSAPLRPKKSMGPLPLNPGIYVLGAPEFVLREGFSELEQEIAPATQAGNRVLAFGKYKENTWRDFGAPVDLVALDYSLNPLRKNAKETFAYFKQQG